MRVVWLELANFVSMRPYIYFLVVFLLLAGCAVQSKPQGGPRDETPPNIVSQSPEMGALRFNGSEATVVFDEYIQARDLRNTMVATPPLEGLEAEIKGKRLLVRWEKQELRAQTTYRITFGDAIGDLNENNTYSNLELVWSTGDYVDSLQLNLSITPQSKVPYESLKVWLVDLNTDTVDSPVFAATPSKDGNVSFGYLPQDTFDILVFEDLNFDNRWDAKSETFGFLKGVSSSLDTAVHSVLYANAKFEIPQENSTIFQDSIATILDTAKSDNLGRLTLVVPNVDTTALAWISHESGYVQSFTFHPMRGVSDTTVIALGNQLPGKYTFSGFTDVNGDSVWTPASWYDAKTAEPILKEQSFELKANWDLEQLLYL